METITAYKTTDGNIHENKDVAERIQRRLDLVTDLQNFCRTQCFDHIEEDMLEVLTDQSEVLYQILHKHLGKS